MASSFVCGNSSVACFGEKKLLCSGSFPKEQVSLSRRSSNRSYAANHLTIFCQARGDEQDKLHNGKGDQFGSSMVGQSAKMKKPLTNVKRVAMLAYVASMAISQPAPTSDMIINLSAAPSIRQETVRVSVQRPKYESLVASISLANDPNLQGGSTVCEIDESEVFTC